MRIFHRHLYHSQPTQRYCASGCRDFFAKHGLNWSDFLRNGIEADKFIETNDSMALRAVEHAQQELSGGK